MLMQKMQKRLGSRIMAAVLTCSMVCSAVSLWPTSASKVKAEGVQYEKDYEDGNPGTWEGADAAVIEDPDHPGNHVLEVKNFVAGASSKYLARETSAPAIADGTLSMKVKAISQSATYYRMGFIYRAEDANVEANALVESGGWFICNEGSYNTGYPKYTALEEHGGLKTNEWLDVKIQFVGEEVEISVNNVRHGKVSVAGQSVKAGTFGFRNSYNTASSFLVDDLVFTTELLDMGEEYVEPEIDTGRLEVSENYGTDSANWTGNPSVVDGTLTVTVPAGGVAVNNNAEMKKMGNGMNTYSVVTDSQGRFGVAFNYVDDTDYNAIYSNNSGEYHLKSPKSGLEQVIASNAVKLEPNTEYEVKIENIEGSYKFYIDGILVQEGTVEGLSNRPGTIGLYNPTNQEMGMKIRCCSVYEMYYYFNDFSDPDNLGGWEGNITVNHVAAGDLNGDGELSIDMKAVTNAVATDTPMIKNGIYEFDIKNTPSSGEGRLGFLFRSMDQNNYQGLFFDIGSNWFWLNNTSYGSFNGKSALKDGEQFHVRLEAEGNNVKLYVDGELIGYGTYSLPEKQGYFGLRKQYSNSNVRLDNLRIQETLSVMPKEKEDIPVTVNSEQMSVTMDKNFPRVLSYQMNGKTMQGNSNKVYGVRLNGTVYYPFVSCEKDGNDTLLYTLDFATLGVVLKLQYVVDGHQLKMNITNIEETGDTLVRDIEFVDDVLVSTDEKESTASMATVLVGGGHTSVSEKIYDTLADAADEQTKQTYGMIASNGLAATINNSAIETNSRLNVIISDGTAAMGNGPLTYRKVADRTEELPWFVVDLCEDYNGDGDINWQDAAANYKNIRDKEFGAEQMKDNMMYIAMNFASQVQEPFLKTLDTGKTLYNYTDGFGQMIMHKGYAAEGHDDSHGDYGGHIGVRQGGVEDFNYIIEEGKKYNLKFGIHINVNEHNPDAYNFDTDPIIHPLSANWGWIDQAYWVDEMEDITSGNRDAKLDELKADLPDLNFVYVDIYSGAGWEAADLVNALNSRGYLVGTEFSGPIEQGAVFTHWGNDIHYPNTGNESIVMRYFKNDTDIFVANALTKGNKMPGVATWGGNSMKEAVETFYNHVLPTKYMQHYDILDIEENYVTFSNGLRTEKVGDRVVMTKDGKKMAEWTWSKSGTQEETGAATLLIPWDPTTEDKLYHWNPAGGTTTWDVPESWTKAGITAADLYKLSADDKEKIGTVQIKDGKIELTAEKGVGYVLYPEGGKAPVVAGNFGEGSPLGNPGFDTRDLSDWEITNNNTTTTVDSNAKYETYLSVKGQAGSDATISQTMKGLTPGTTNTVYLFADISKGSHLDMTVDVAGKQYSHSAEATDVVYHGQSKYEGSSYQKVKVTFDVPEGVTEAKLTLKASMTQNNGYVSIDDVRVWENLNRTLQITDKGYENYVIYEDFENVEQGYGVFELAYASGIYTHLAEYNAEKNQYVDYVVDGNFSLKTNELGSYVGQVLRTNPNQVEMKANTEYEISFAYQTGVEGRHHLEVRNSKGDVVYRYDFVPTELEENSNSLSNREITDTFTTGDAEDYYLAVYKDSDNMAYPQTQNKEGSYMERVYLSLDNVIVKEVVKEQPVKADKTLLQMTYDRVKGANTDGVVESAVKFFEQSLAKAEAVLADETATQEEVNAAWDQLLDATWGLGLYKGDKGELQKVMDQAKAMDKDDYEADNWGMLEEALAEAERVNADEDATQDVVDKATEALQEAIDAQVKKQPVDKEILKSLIDRANEMLPNEAKYVAANWPELAEKLTEGQKVYDNEKATQEEVDKAADNLLEAILAQRFKADKSSLEELLKKVETIDTSLYTAETVQVFRAALANAKAVMADATLSESDQQIVDAAVKALADAKDGLKLADNGNIGNTGNDKDNSNQDNNGNQNGGTDAPKTGDTMPVGLWVSLVGAAMFMAALLAGRKRKNIRA